MMTARLRLHLIHAAAAFVLMALPQVALARVLEPSWPVGTYAYLVSDQDIRVVLKDFGRQMRIPIALGGKVRGRLSGRLKSAAPRAFLDSLCASYGLVWYYDGAAVHVTSLDDRKSELVPLSAPAPADFTERMRVLGLVDERFELRLTPDRRAAIISGPEDYVAQVRRFIPSVIGQQSASAEVRSAIGDDPRVRVFRGGKSAR
jgi:type III secretion protein C